MKKFLAGLMAFCLVSMPVLAAVKISDVKNGYWAEKEIREVVADKIMTVNDNGEFLPETKMTRVEFVNALLVVLNNDNLDVNIKNKFTDVSPSDKYYQNILRSEQLGLVYGCPDRTFRPDKLMIRAETQSVVSHITVDKTVDMSVLDEFTDSAEIPGWARVPYAKSIKHGIYVNHPDQKELRPVEELTRAEAAVLLATLKNKMALVKDQYCGKEKVLATEHLKVKRNAPNNEVKITEKHNAILAGNVLAVAFGEKFKTKQHLAGDKVYFTNNKTIYTVEGTELIPAGSKFDASVLDIKDPRWFNKNGKVYMQLNQVVFPNGKVVPLNAKPFYKEYALKEAWWMNAGKVAASTVAGAGVGTAAAVGIAFIPDPALIGKAVAIGTPVGAGVGLVTGLVTPGLKYNARCGEKIFVILLEDANILK